MRRPGPYLLTTLFLAFTAAVLISAFSPAAAKPRRDPPETAQKTGKSPTRLLVRSGTLISENGAPIQLHAFEADIVEGSDKKATEHVGNKVVLVKSSDAFLTNDALGRLLNGKLKDHSLEEIKVSNEKGQVKITGKAKKGISAPFTIEGPVSLTSNGQIRIEMKKENVAHLPKRMTQLLGIDPEKLAGDGTVKGVSSDKDSISFDPDLLWGLPIHGRVTNIKVQNNGLLLIFGGQPQKPVLRARNAQ
jgi:hypothetical protein